MRLRGIILVSVALLCTDCSTNTVAGAGRDGPPPRTMVCPDGSVAPTCADYASENASAEWPVENASAGWDDSTPPAPPVDIPTNVHAVSSEEIVTTSRHRARAGGPVVVAHSVAYAAAAPATAAAPGIAEPCDAIRGRMATAGDCREYARQRGALANGVAAFQPPPEMIVGVPTRLTLQVGAAGDAAVVVESLGGDPAKAKQFIVKVGDSMAAELSGPAELFKISPGGRVVKQMPDNHRQSWSWDVTPLAPSPKPVNLTLTVGVPAIGAAGAADFYLESKDYPVKVRARRPTPVGFVEALTTFFTSLKGMIVALGAAIAAASAVWIGLRKFGKETPPTPPK